MCYPNAMHCSLLSLHPSARVHACAGQRNRNRARPIEPRTLARLDGIVPVNLLKSRYKFCSDDIDPSIGGMVPDSSFDPTYLPWWMIDLGKFRDWSVGSKSGVVVSNFLTHKLKTFNEEIISGMVPYNSFWVRKLDYLGNLGNDGFTNAVCRVQYCMSKNYCKRVVWRCQVCQHVCAGKGNERFARQDSKSSVLRTVGLCSPSRAARIAKAVKVVKGIVRSEGKVGELIIS